MRVIGLTGGMGSGKSTVAALLAAAGAVVVDADQAARDVVEPGQPALAEIVDRFGDEVLAADGTLDRPALARVVFADAEALADLEAITHPRIAERIAEQFTAVADAEAADGHERTVVLDHPLLVETGQARQHEIVLVVVAPVDVRVRRLADGRGIDEEDARARIARQTSDETRRAAATHVIDNGGDLDALAEQVEELVDELGITP